MDLIEYVMPPNLKMEQTERDFSETKDHIKKSDHLHMADIKDRTDSSLTSQMRINLFLREWNKVKEREIESLIFKSQLQLERV